MLVPLFTPFEISFFPDVLNVVKALALTLNLIPKRGVKLYRDYK